MNISLQQSSSPNHSISVVRTCRSLWKFVSDRGHWRRVDWNEIRRLDSAGGTSPLHWFIASTYWRAMAGCKASCATKDEQQFAFDYNFIPATERDAKQRPKGGPSSRVISRSTNAIISGTHNSSDVRQFFFLLLPRRNFSITSASPPDEASFPISHQIGRRNWLNLILFRRKLVLKCVT